MANAVETLTLAAFYFNNTAYAQRAVFLLRTWFLDENSSMNPNANFAQSIPGRCDGRGIGLIDFAKDWPVMIDCIKLLEWLGSWEATDAAAMHIWWTKWLQWLWNSKNGHDERAALNNHGSYYDVQTLAAANYVGNQSIIAAICSEAATRRLDVQIGPNGTLPLEDKRTKSEAYHGSCDAWQRAGCAVVQYIWCALP